MISSTRRRCGRHQISRRINTVLAALTVAVAGTVVAVAPANAAPARASDATATVNWQPCTDEGAAGFDCGTLTVPLDYDAPAGPSIELSLIRKPATDPAHRIGSVVFNPGGPGNSGTLNLPAYYPHFPADVRARFDVVSFDPRGINKSAPVSCFASEEEEAALMSQAPVGFPTGAAEQSTWVDVYAQLGRACAANAGPILQHTSTANVARDMDRIRGAVGDQQLTYFGISYGTYLGTTYANLFPTRVRAMVLESNVDPNAWTDQVGGRLVGTFLRQGSDVGTAETAQRFLAQCGQVGPERCAFAAGSAGATSAKFATLLDRLAAHPVDLGGTVITRSYALILTTVGLYDTRALPDIPSITGWVGLAAVLQQLWLASTDAGAPTAALRRALAALATNQPARLGPPSPFGGLYSVVCADSPNPRDPASYPAQAAVASVRSGPFADYWTWSGEPCATWPAADADRYTGPYDKPLSAPVLVVGLRYDPATPYSASVTLANTLSRARLLTVNGAGHTTLLNPSTCTADAEARYLVSGALPAAGTVCSEDAAPF